MWCTRRIVRIVVDQAVNWDSTSTRVNDLYGRRRCSRLSLPIGPREKKSVLYSLFSLFLYLLNPILSFYSSLFFPLVQNFPHKTSLLKTTTTICLHTQVSSFTSLSLSLLPPSLSLSTSILCSSVFSPYVLEILQFSSIFVLLLSLEILYT